MCSLITSSGSGDGTRNSFESLFQTPGARGVGGHIIIKEPYGVGRVSVTGKCRGLYILHYGKLTAVGGRFLYARHLENVVFDLGGLA